MVLRRYHASGAPLVGNSRLHPTIDCTADDAAATTTTTAATNTIAAIVTARGGKAGLVGYAEAGSSLAEGPGMKPRPRPHTP